MNNKAHLRPKDFDSNGDIIPMSWKEERPQGEWIVKSNGTTNYYACNKCGSAGDIQDKFCRECGAGMRKMADEKKNRFGYDPFFCSSSSKGEAEEARREAMMLDENEDSLKWRFNH